MPPRRSSTFPSRTGRRLKYTLAATLVKSSSHWRAFETAFEVFFAVRTGAGAGEGEELGEGRGDTEEEGGRGTRRGCPDKAGPGRAAVAARA